VSTVEFERARSPEAKQARESAILDAARRLATARGVRAVSLTDIAAEVGMHKSAMLRYFETREDIFLRLSAAEWSAWSSAFRDQLAASAGCASPRAGGRAPCRLVATLLADSLAARPLFCDLLAHTPLNLERNVSFDAVRAFKTRAVAETASVSAALRAVLPLDESQARNVVTTATSMAGALWHMAAPGTELRRFYETDPALAHAVVDVAPRLTDILTALALGYGTAGQCGDAG